jgi:hypothetical protein
MAKQPETTLKEKVLADLRQLPHTYAVKIQQVAIRGTPDILACIQGYFVALELKRDGKQKPDPLQLHELGKIEKAHGITLVVCPQNWPETLKKLDYIAEHGVLTK